MELPEEDDEPVAIQRSPVRISRDLFERVLTLTDKQPWLKEKQEGLIYLVEECNTGEEQELVCDLLSRFCYVSAERFQELIQAMASHIEQDWGLAAETTLICALDNSKYADSSQVIVYALKAAAWTSDAWNTSSFVNGLSKLVDAGKNPLDVVLVDEFIGTGETAEKAINWLRTKLAEAGLTPRIRVVMLAAMEDGITRIEPLIHAFYAPIVLKKGISGHYDQTEGSKKLALMTTMEDRLSDVSRRGKLKSHRLGYGQAESLFSRKGGNTPNNVFPIFWWELDRNNKNRKTVLKCL